MNIDDLKKLVAARKEDMKDETPGATDATYEQACDVLDSFVLSVEAGGEQAELINAPPVGNA